MDFMRAVEGAGNALSDTFDPSKGLDINDDVVKQHYESKLNEMNMMGLPWSMDDARNDIVRKGGKIEGLDERQQAELSQTVRDEKSERKTDRQLTAIENQEKREEEKKQNENQMNESIAQLSGKEGAMTQQQAGMLPPGKEAEQVAQIKEDAKELGTTFANTDMSNEQFIQEAKARGYTQEQTIDILKSSGFTSDGDVNTIMALWEGKEPPPRKETSQKGSVPKDSPVSAIKEENIQNIDDALSLKGQEDLTNIVEGAIENSEYLTDEGLTNMLTDIKDQFGNFGIPENYINEIPTNVLRAYKEGTINKKQAGDFVVDAILTGIGNFGRGMQGKEMIDNKFGAMTKENLQKATERYNQSKTDKQEAYKNAIEGMSNISREQQQKGLDLLQDSQIMQTMARFNEKAGIRELENIVSSEKLSNLSRSQKNDLLEIQLMMGTIQGQDILAKAGADLGLDLASEIEEKGFTGGMSTFFGGLIGGGK